jgi:cytochrome P450
MTGPVIDFDHHSTGYRDHGLEILGDLRGRCPVAWTESYGGFWVLSRYRDVARVEVDATTFSSHHETGGDQIPIPELPFTPIPIFIDPPEFTPYRRMLDPVFAPKAVAGMRDDIRRATDDAIDEFVESGRCEMVMQLANVVPATTALGILGMPVSDWARYTHAMHEILYRMPGTPEHDAAVQGNIWMIEQIVRVVAERRQQPRDDLISQWTTATVDGEPISDSYIQGMAWLVIAGGTETTGSLLANTVVHLARKPDVRRRLREEPDLLPTAVEEFLRWVTPTQHIARTATRDVQIDGRRISAGQRVFLSLASANRDEEQFPGADEVILDRRPNRHTAFGLGPHRCLGSHLGRAMFTTMLEQVVHRLGDFELLDGAERYPSTGAFSGYISVPIRFQPGPRLRPASPTHSGGAR